MSRPSFTMTMLAVMLLTSCESGVTEPVALSIQIVAGDNQVAPAGSTLDTPLMVRVSDSRGRSAAGVVVNWRVEDGGGSLTSTNSPTVTGTDGIASIRRTLGGLAGSHRTSAALERHADAKVMFTAIAQIQGATQIVPVPVPGGNPVDTVLATLAPFAVSVTDHNDAPVGGVVVTWSSSDGSLSSATSVTDANGIAEATYTLGSRATAPSELRVNATVFGLIGSPAIFHAASTPGNPVGIVTIAGDEEWGVVQGMTVYTAGVTDAYGNLIEGVSVDWRVATGSGSIEPARSVTARSEDTSQPVATAVHTLGPDEGVESVSATATDIPGSPQVTFSATVATASVSLLASEWSFYDCYYYGTCASMFNPDKVVVPVGRTVIWVWQGVECDLVFEDDPTEPTSSAARSSGVHARTFSHPGIYHFRCTRYSWGFTHGMVGQVTVE